MSDIINKGDLVWVNFTQQSGHEQKGHRPALVITPEIYHEKSKLALVCPITSNIQPWPWKVILPESSEVQGAVLVDQLRSIEREAGKMKKIASVPKEVIDDVVAKLSVLIMDNT